MRWAGHVAQMGKKEECLKPVGIKTREKETTRKVKK
jgi:hypothetical protein